MRDKSSYERPHVNVEGLANLADIKPGVRLQTWRDGRKWEIVTVASRPFFKHQADEYNPDGLFGDSYANGLWIDFESKYDYWLLRRMSLADMGIVPYEWGQWNRGNYCTLAEPLTPKTFEAVTPYEFFRQLDEWLKMVDARDSDYRDEWTLPVQVPTSLQNIVNKDEFTATVPAEYSYLSPRTVTVQLIHA